LGQIVQVIPADRRDLGAIGHRWITFYCFRNERISPESPSIRIDKRIDRNAVANGDRQPCLFGDLADSGLYRRLPRLDLASRQAE
jgi:hypothetical protein